MALTLTPGTSVQVIPGQTVAFTAQETGGDGNPLQWTMTPADAIHGTLSAAGVYRAPSQVPDTSVVTITAYDAQDALSSSTTIAIVNPVPSLSGISPAVLTVGTVVSGTISGTGFMPDTTFLLGGSQLATTYVSPSTITFTNVTVPPSSPSVVMLAATPGPGGGSSQLSVSTRAGISVDAAARFLQQASWGPTPELIAHVQQVGFDAFLDEQFASSEDSYSSTNFQWVQEFFAAAIHQHDSTQLRTKVGWAWYKLFNSPGTVVAGMLSSVPNLTNREAFGTYNALLTDVSLNIEMGFYFNYCCWDVAASVTGVQPDENFGRELMQQFSIGPYNLKSDGSLELAADGSPAAAYSMDDVRAISRGVTGLTYDQDAAWAGADPEGLVPMNSASASYHDSGAKTLLGTSLPGNTDAVSEVRQIVSLLSSQPNTGRHLSAYLIHELVTSNPSAAYVGRVADVWANDGSGVKGNLRAVVRAVLLDAEARKDDDVGSSVSGDGGRIKDPLNFAATVLREFGAAPVGGVPLYGKVKDYAMLSHEAIFAAPSVFGYYSDSFGISGSSLLAPEAQIYTTDAELARADFVAFVFGLQGANNAFASSVDWSQWASLASGDGAPLLDKLNHLCFHGTMSDGLRAVLAASLQELPASDPTARVQQTAYLAVMSPEFSVER